MSDVDDLLLAAPSEESCLQATQLLLSHLAKVGLKCSKDKLQIARLQVAFLGRLISQHGTGISLSHKDDILHHPKPTNVKQMLSFLGLCNYSRHHVPDFAKMTHSLRQLVNEKGMRNLSHVLDWTQDAETYFVPLKQFLSSAAALVVPDFTRMFFLDVSEKSSSVSAVLFHKTVDGNRHVCLYASTPLERYEKRHHVCAVFSSALARLIQKTSHIVLHHPLTVRTSHSTVQYVTSQAFTMTGGRQRKIESVLTQPHILFIHEGRNTADGLLEGQLHCCTQRTLEDNSLRDDFYDIPLDNPDLTLFTDGCCFKGDKGFQSGIAVTQMTGSTFELKVAERFTGQQSAQRAEIIAVTSALKLAKDKTVNIYTDSAYAHVVLHTAIKERLRNDFMTAFGCPIKHQQDIFNLMDALLLPKALAVIKCKGHSKNDDFVSVGNDSADRAAKYVAGYSPELQFMVSEGELGDRQEIIPETIKQWQLKASPEEKSVWLAKGAKQDDAGIWLREDETLRRLQNWSHPYMKQIVKSELQDCSVCNKFNCMPTTKPPPGTHDQEVTAPGQERGHVVAPVIYQARWIWLNAATKVNHLMINAHTSGSHLTDPKHACFQCLPDKLPAEEVAQRRFIQRISTGAHHRTARLAGGLSQLNPRTHCVFTSNVHLGHWAEVTHHWLRHNSQARETIHNQNTEAMEDDAARCRLLVLFFVVLQVLRFFRTRNARRIAAANKRMMFYHRKVLEAIRADSSGS
ncbi:uncharacterized protein LOC144040636 [Vanacampus margaritifer]